MTENKYENEGFHQYPDQITLGQRLTKADVEHRRMLYRKSLDEKWYIIQSNVGKSFQYQQAFGLCAFCVDADEKCEGCKIAPALCQNGGYEGLYKKFRKVWHMNVSEEEEKKVIDKMVSEMEARIVDCDSILKAMETKADGSL